MNFDKYLEKDYEFLSSISNDWIEELYKKVNNYVINNYIYEGENEEYYLKYKDKYFQIGWFYGPDLFYFIKSVNEEEVNSYINYDYVKYNIVNMNQIKIRNQINEINKEIIKLEEQGVSKRLLLKSIKF